MTVNTVINTIMNVAVFSWAFLQYSLTTFMLSLKITNKPNCCSPHCCCFLWQHVCTTNGLPCAVILGTSHISHIHECNSRLPISSSTVLVRICIAPRRKHTSKVLRYGTHSQVISQFLHTPCPSTNGLNHTCLCLPSQSWCVLMWR